MRKDNPIKILFLISEVEDIVKTGGLADVGKALPLALAEIGHEVRIVLPYYAAARAMFDLPDATPEQVLYVNGQIYSYAIKQLNFNGIEVLLVDYPEYFDQTELYSRTSQVSNSEKFSFFSLAALKASEAIGFRPDIIHTNDWHTSMACYFTKFNDGVNDFYRHTKSVLTIHNAAFQGVDQLENIKSVGSGQPHLYVENGYLNLLKTGLLHADKICPVSPTYAAEIATELGGHGIHDVIRHRINDVVGILNGCDYEQWDPNTDQQIAAQYNIKSLKGKSACKKALQAEFDLPQTKTVPLLGMVCRTTTQKGFGYILPILSALLKHKVQLVIVGTGEQNITDPLHEIASIHSEKFRFINDFKPEYAHMVEAGSDFFLMPSQFEPCGLNQMYSLAYGTLPIVRGVGGLKDTVINIDEPNGNGFVFAKPLPGALLNTIRKALLLYHESPTAITSARKRAMKQRFTWENAAKQYADVYLSVKS